MPRHRQLTTSVLSAVLTLAALTACSPRALSPTSPAVPTLTDVPAPMPTREPTQSAPPEPPEFESFGEDISRELPAGDPARGAVLFGPQGEFCSACHSQLMIGPPMEPYDNLPAIVERASETIGDPAYTGHASSATEYLVESIVRPNEHSVPGFTEGTMPASFGSLLTTQDLADLIAYLLTIE